jgi:hypothetical protein
MDVGLEALRWERLELIPGPLSGHLDVAVDPQRPVLELQARRRTDGQYRKVIDEMLAGR